MYRTHRRVAAGDRKVDHPDTDVEARSALPCEVDPVGFIRREGSLLKPHHLASEVRHR